MEVCAERSTPPSTPSAPGGGEWHRLPVEQAAARLGGDRRRGLDGDEAARRLLRHGPNVLRGPRGRAALAILASQFRSLVVLLLLSATALALAIGETIEAAAIAVVIVLNAAIGFLTEWKAERALSALERHLVALAHVVREGAERQVPAAQIVPGDLVVLTAGERVPADGRIVEEARLTIDEALLTGESRPAVKTAGPIEGDDLPLGDRLNLAFMGTTIVDGRGRMLVTATGSRTEVGRIGRMIEEAPPRTTPLERKVARLSRALVVLVLGLCAVIVAAGAIRGRPFLEMLEIGVSLAIAAVPEGLPAVVTMALALGVQRMARRRVVVRRLAAVETLGSTTVICTDKTGTLTRNEMTVRRIVLDGRVIEVTGAGYAPAGEFRLGEVRLDPRADGHLALALRIAVLCNDARIERRGGRFLPLGDPTEAALVAAGMKAGLDPDGLARDYPRVAEVPFDSRSRRMVTVHRTPEGTLLACVKGAPSALLESSRRRLGPGGAIPLTAEDAERLRRDNDAVAGDALRVLALAVRDLPDDFVEEDLARDLVFVGLVGLDDPLRDEAGEAIATCRDAGIRTVMITGDQQATAARIAARLGLDRDAAGRPLAVVHGRDLVPLDASGWRRLVARAGVFARVSPAHKVRIVEALQRNGEIVAMTGDGVNDAPALKRADIGVAMGIKGTEVAREAADLVLADDNFATIVRAVEQGRVIYASIIRFIHYLFSCNLAEMMVIFVAALAGWALPLGALQILWLNLVTDVFPALALALEPSGVGVMRRAPRDPGEALVTPRLAGLIAWQGALLAAVTLVAFGAALRTHGTDPDGLRRATTVAFMTLALAQVFHTFNVRSRARSAFSRGLLANPWLWGAVGLCLLLQVAALHLPILQRTLRTLPAGRGDWGIIAACSLAPIGLVEIVKAGFRRRVLRRGAPR
jgi:Ca2+-transporting ATPase